MEEIKLVYFNSLNAKLADANKKIEELNDLEARLIETDKELEKANKKIKRLEKKANRDFLTGLYNHSYYKDNINKTVKDSVKKGQNVGLLVIDLNNVKYANDILGHPKTNEIFKSFAKYLLSSIRGYDAAIRVGGDEFLVIARKATLRTEQKIKGRLNNLLKLYNQHTGKELNYILSFSAGYAIINPLEKNAIESAFKIADDNMYKQKYIFRLRNVLINHINKMNYSNINK